MRQNQFYDKLRELGYSGNVNQMLWNFLKTEGYSGQLNGMLWKYFRANGMTGSMSKMLKDFDVNDLGGGGASVMPSFRDIGAFAAAGNAALNTVSWGNTTPEVVGIRGLLCTSCAGDVTIGTPAGWTVEQSYVNTASASYKKIQTFSRVATSGSEADVTFTPSSGSSQAFIITFNDAETSTIELVRTLNGVAGDLGVALFPDASTAGDDRFVIDICTAVIDAAGQQTTVDLINATLASYTVRMDDGSASGGGGALTAATGGKATAGLIGTSTCTWSASSRFTGMTLAIAPE